MIRKHKQSGFVLVTMTLSAIAMLGALGLAVDMGRLFIIKNETQHFCDSAAIAAALNLDGTTAGITNATAAAKSLANNWNFGTTSISNPIVEYATASAGPWSTNPNPATDYIYARVKTSVSAPLFFVPVVMTTKVYTQTVNSLAIAGQIAQTTLNTGLSPYAGIVQNTTVSSLGFVLGKEYMIQQAACCNAGGNGANACNAAHPANCYIGNICNDDSDAALLQTYTTWGSAQSGYWGYQSNSLIRAAILDLVQLQSVSYCPWATFGTNMANCAAATNIEPSLSNGQHQQQADDLDIRSNQDTYILTAAANGNPGNGKKHLSVDSATTYTNYMAALHNGTANRRRLITAPIVWPVDGTTTTVAGYAYFLLETNIFSGSGTTSYYKSTTNGNDGYCAIYAGPVILGGGVAGSSGPGAYQVQLVQ